MSIRFKRKQVETLYEFKDMPNDFVVDDSGKLFALVGGHPLILVGISNEFIESPWD